MRPTQPPHLVLPFLLVGFAPILPLVGYIDDSLSLLCLVLLTATAYGALGVFLSSRLRTNWQDMSFFGMLIAGGFAGSVFLFLHEGIAAAPVGALIGVQVGAFQGLAVMPIAEAAHRIGRSPPGSVLDRLDRHAIWRRTIVVAMFAVLLSPRRFALELALVPYLVALLALDVKAWLTLRAVERNAADRVPYDRLHHGPLPSGTQLFDIGLGEETRVAIADADSSDPYRATKSVVFAVRGELGYALHQWRDAIGVDVTIAVGLAGLATACAYLTC